MCIVPTIIPLAQNGCQILLPSPLLNIYCVPATIR